MVKLGKVRKGERMKYVSYSFALLLSLTFLPLPLIAEQLEGKEQGIIFKGSIFRTDKRHPVGGAVILMWKEQSSGDGEGLLAKTDSEGNYFFACVEPGLYTISIRTWHGKLEDVPCRFKVAETAEGNSIVAVMAEKDRYVEQVFIKGFFIKGVKEMSKDFNIACREIIAR